MIEIVFRVALAGVLAGAALAKLAAPGSSRAAMATFGFAEGRTRDLAWAVLIAVELGLALAVAIGVEAAALAAAALMLLFAAVTAGALMRGQAGAPCACFGASSKVSRLSVARNLALAAGFAAIPFIPSTDPSAEAWLAAGIGVALAACAALGVAVLALAREVGMLRLQLGTQGALEIAGEGPEVGAAAPPLAERIPMNGARLALGVFSSEGCQLCQTLSPAIENVAKDPLVAVGVFDEAADAELWRWLGVPGSPFAIALDDRGTVLAKGTFNSLAQLESVLATAERRRASGVIEDEDRNGERALGGLPIGA
jgi:Methylamine utilisation protein MauE